MDPLAQLQDIQLPDKIHNYPIAIGWWILAIICIALLLFISFKIIKNKKIKHSQQQALSKLSSTETTIEECVTVLKWAALQYFPRKNIANLYGEGFYLFLQNTLPLQHQEKFKTLSADSLQNMYQKNSSVEENNNFHQASIYWLKHALPPKNNLAATTNSLAVSEALPENKS
ncbi:DUF4381 domain-containing protein [Pseudocolwellia agarivorans]|uniref:DUF4381 domain-containing protein n=1 Tax=Pseudocolwellia agarivorans TaxID=1911682 RepID=UPI00158CFC39|nr:DUF4381 domain-containing protein [Pseudocolwellia agarivorans]